MSTAITDGISSKEDESMKMLELENIFWKLYLQEYEKEFSIETDKKNDELATAESSEMPLVSLSGKVHLLTCLLGKLNKKKNRNQHEVREQLDYLMVMLEEMKERMADLEGHAYSFKKQITDQTGKSRHGTTKTLTDNIVSFLETKLMQQEIDIDKLIMKKTNLRNKKMKLEMELKQKEEVEKKFNFDDFHKLQENNKELEREIREKNEKYSQLNLSVGNLEKQLKRKRGELNNIEEKKDEKQKLLALRRRQIDRVDREIKTERSKCKKKQNIKFIDNKKKIMNDESLNNIGVDSCSSSASNDENGSTLFNMTRYAENKTKIKDLKNAIKSKERKIEIATIHFGDKQEGSLKLVSKERRRNDESLLVSKTKINLVKKHKAVSFQE